VPPRQLEPTTAEELEWICLKCLAKPMMDRFASVADLAADLKGWLAGATAATASRGAVGSGDESRQPDSELLRVVPKGLRSFDSLDADFFLELLPGARDRKGLPESLRFWKSRVEQRDPDEAFGVGVLYGPSGCGKSSLVKAGLIPRLAEHV